MGSLKSIEETRVNYIDDIKKILATNLTAKGQASTINELLSVLVAKVANVSTGKKFAQGTITSVEYGAPYTVSGLDFIPKTIVVCYRMTNDATTMNKSFVGRREKNNNAASTVGWSSTGDASQQFIQSEPDSTSFTITNNYSSAPMADITWYAYEGVI